MPATHHSNIPERLASDVSGIQPSRHPAQASLASSSNL